MIIVSQDGRKIINFNQVQEIEINTPLDWNQGIYSVDTYPLGEGNNQHIQLGQYKTKERVQEVLQEIIEIFKIAIPTAVYEMPKE